jgi:PAS domain-containing protein
MSGNNKNKWHFPERINTWIIVTLAAILVAGSLFTWWIVKRAEQNMRNELLQEAKLIERAISVERIKRLKGNETDLGSPDYRRLKEYLAIVRKADDKVRFLYLMGRKPDGSIFIYVDSESVESKDYSPPGQPYEEAPTGYRGVFESGASSVVGPVEDRGGTWISALVPIIDPSTDALVAVMGIDVDASTWKRSIIGVAVIPVAMQFLLLVAGVLGIVTAFSRSELHKSEGLLSWKTALLEAQMNATVDATIVIGEVRKRLSINQRLIDLFNVPGHVIEDEDSIGLLHYIAGMSSQPQEFIEKSVYFTDHPNEASTFEMGLNGGVTLECYSAPVVGDDGEYYGRIWTFRDITDRRRMDEEVRHSEKLAAALEMAGAVCHELNQPLQVISARVDLLRMQRSNDPVSKTLQVISDHVLKMGAITRKIMGLEKYSNRKYIGDIKITDIEQIHKDDAE